MAPVESKLDYTKARDIHSAGIVLLQMLLGRDVMERYDDPQVAIHMCESFSTTFKDEQNLSLVSAEISTFLSTKAAAILSPAKKGSVTCQSLLLDLVSAPCPPAVSSRTPTIPFAGSSVPSFNTTISAWLMTCLLFSGPKTPVVGGFAVGSPEIDYFRMPPPTARHSSRWKEDWEELEILGRGGFGQVVKARNKIDNRIYAGEY